MDYEKKYKEALKDASYWMKEKPECKDLLKGIFPELAESEDERIRKWLIEECQKVIDMANPAYDTHKAKEAIAWLEKQKEQKPAKSIFPPGIGEVHFNPVSVVEQKSTQTTIFGQDYKCKKDYKEGNCWYVKDVIYHCNRDGYLIDQNGVSWSCSPEWFKEYILTNNEWAEKEKNDFVSGQFIQCVASFDLFKEDEYYWLEYVGNDTYIGRSDNVLNQKFHITPRQLFTRFSQHLEETTPLQETNIKPETLYLNNPSGEQIADALIHYLNEQNGILTAINCIKVQDIINWLNSKKEQNLADVAPNQFDCIIYGMQGCSTEKPAKKIRSDIIMAIRAFYKCEREDLVNYVKSLHIVKQEWSEEDSEMLDAMVDIVANSLYEPLCPRDKMLDWLKSLPERFNLQPKPEWSEEDELMIITIIQTLEMLGGRGTTGMQIDWLKSKLNGISTDAK